ncbi:hypothetical protein MNBD_CHLOROFLEXI01-128 [hydrothermal vent metagenome]|uniref:DUF385 domain-containing protein n=1 Tax=hydrothermal vent metagenome TaxID=652676 RepID=A0A3B0UM14_9ZZZZ
MTTLQGNNPNSPPPPPAWFNKMMLWMLRSPLHGIVSKDIMLITIAGRKSGKKYTLPVSYVREGNKVICSTDRAVRLWWRNLRGGANVTLWLRGKEVTGQATVIYDDPEAIAKGIETMLKYVPRDAKYYNVRLDGGKRPLAEDIAQSAQHRVIVEIKI